MEYAFYAIMGFLGGVVRAIVTGKGVILLPRLTEQEGSKYMNLGFLTPALVGAFVGFLAPHAVGTNGVIAGLAGYAGVDMIENLIERALKLPRGR